MAAQNIIDQVLNFVLTADKVEVTQQLLNATVEITNVVCETTVSLAETLGPTHTVLLAGVAVAGITAVSLGRLYSRHNLFKLLIDAATKNGVGGERGDQNVEIREGSLHVRLRCFTDERFLEVWADYESGSIKERLQKEFSNVGIEVEGLKVKIENTEEVEKTIATINKRSSFYPIEVMAEGEATTTKHQGFYVDVSEEHGNWLTVGELIRSIRKPISTYVDEIVKPFHEKLCKDLLPVGNCSSSEDCKKKTKSSDLCKSCKCWFVELQTSHEKGNNPSWHKNCNCAEWSKDHWEVAKFFMPALGSNLSSTKDAESTDLSSLLNVLEWMKDGAFLGKVRVSVDLVRKLRSQVINTWAYAPQQELSDDKKAEIFSIATDFLEDLEKVFSHAENAKCLEHLKHLKTSGVTDVDVVESERQSSKLQSSVLAEEATEALD